MASRERVLQPLPPRLRARRARHAAGAHRRSDGERRGDARADARGGGAAQGDRRRIPGARALGLQLRGPVPPAGAAARLRRRARLAARALEGLPIAAFVGLPVVVDGLLYNCAALICRGRLLGVVPKTYLPNYREFYELRQFTPGGDAAKEIQLARARPCPSAPLIFRLKENPQAAPLRGDLRGPLGAGAALLLRRARRRDGDRQPFGLERGRSASTQYRARARRQPVGALHRRLPLQRGGRGRIHHRPRLGRPRHGLRERLAAGRIASASRSGAQLTFADVDLDRLEADRMRQNSFGESARRHAAEIARFRTVDFSLPVFKGVLKLERKIERFPYVPGRPGDARRALRGGLPHPGRRGSPRACAPPARRSSSSASRAAWTRRRRCSSARASWTSWACRGRTSSPTPCRDSPPPRARARSAWQLMRAVGATPEEIDIRPSCMQMFQDMGHPYAKGRKQSTTSPSRTCRRASAPATCSASPTITAAWWSAPATCPSWRSAGHIWRWRPYVALQRQRQRAQDPDPVPDRLGGAVRAVRRGGEQGARARAGDRNLARSSSPADQKTEDTVGPYELQDFHLYYTLRFGYAPAKVAFLAWHAWQDKYTLADIRQWLEVFLRRFFQTSQFKRSALPNGPKVGSGGSLSPRGDWRAPSDGNASAWLEDLKKVPATARGSSRRGSPANRRDSRGTASDRR